jgi:benzylsuccinate CoA-transferase BbsF subunit
MTTDVQALEGLKVIEFGGYAAGPHIGKILANFGAVVVHVESTNRPDGFRMQYPPYKDGVPGVERSGCFALFNDSKYGVTIDLKTSGGLERAYQLAKWCDVIIENMRPGVMDRLGLGFAKLQHLNPRLIMLSTCNMGQTGPRASTPGFGSQLSALAGFCNLTGESGGPPMLLYGPYIDFIASTLATSAVMAALLRRERSGKGAHLDVSQYECGLMFLAGALFDYHATGRVAERAGNDDPEAAPHGAYRCGDGQWLALSVWSDNDFANLARAIRRTELTDDSRLSDLAGRKEHAEFLRAVIEGWAQAYDTDRAAEVLQEAGVAAYPVNTISRLFSDPQLLSRHLWRRRRHPVIGDHRYEFPGFDLSATPGDITAPAPTLGQDNDKLLAGFLERVEEDEQG